MRSCLVIGGGVAGMASAVMLGQAGFDITLVESSPALGALLRGFERNGYHFETGFHFARGLDRDGPLRNWLKALGLELRLDALIPHTEIACVGNECLPLPISRDWIGKNFQKSLAGYDKFQADALAAQRSSPFMAQDSNASFSPLSTQRTSLWKYFDDLAIDKELRPLLAARSLLYGVAPNQATFEDFFLVSGFEEDKSFILPEGGKGIAKAFEKRLLDLGVRIIRGNAVEKIVNESGYVKGVILANDDFVPAELIVFTGNPKQLQGMIGKSTLRPAWFSHIAAMRETPEPYGVYGVCDCAVPTSHMWYCVPEDGGLHAVENRDCAMGIMTGAAVPGKPHSIMALGLKEEREIPFEEIVKIAEQKLPLLKGHWKPMGMITGNGMRKFIHGSSGSIYGFAHTVNTMPLLSITKLRGLFLAGQNILLPGMLGCIISAAIASSMIAGPEKILGNFRKCAEE